MSESGAGDARPDDDYVSLVGCGFGSAFSMSGAFHAINPGLHRSTALPFVLQKQTAEDKQPQQGGEDPPEDALIHHYFRTKMEQLSQDRTDVAGGFSLSSSFVLLSHYALLASRFSKRGVECVSFSFITKFKQHSVLSG